MISRRWLVFGLAALATGGWVACKSTKKSDDPDGLLPAGATVPALTAVDQNGKEVRLRDRENPVVVYFYPKDGTPGCTKEACAFRDAWKAFDRARVGVIGVSSDSRESHVDFAKEHALPFPLVSDEDGAWSKAFGVQTHFGMMSRVSFLVSDNEIIKTYPDVDPAVHATEVLADAEAARKKH